jgi:site-specific recombinase XerD
MRPAETRQADSRIKKRCWLDLEEEKMGRPRKDASQGLPLRVYLKSGQFYYVHHDSRWEGLGRDLEVARKKANAYNADKPLTGTMGDWLKKWHVFLEKQQRTGRLKPRTVQDYKSDSTLLTEYFGKMYPSDIQAKHITDYLEIGVDLERPIRANREKAALSSCMTWMLAHSHGNMVQNFCLVVPRNPETPRDRYITDDEYHAVFDLASPPVRAMMVMIYRTLQRPADVLSWTRRNISEVDGQRILSFRQGKTGRDMSIIMNKDMDDALAAMRAAREVEGMPLICTQQGQHYTEMGLSSMFRRHVKDSGVIDFALYDHKAKGATDMFSTGTSLEVICGLCGHKSVKTTEIYIKSHTRTAVPANDHVIERKVASKT